MLLGQIGYHHVCDVYILLSPQQNQGCRPIHLLHDFVISKAENYYKVGSASICP